LGEIWVIAKITRIASDGNMSSEVQSDQVKLDPNRRKFLKISLVAGAAAAAATVVGAGAIKGLASSPKSLPEKEQAKESASLMQRASNGHPMILVVNGGRVEILQGAKGFVVEDSSFASEITSKVKGRMVL
jgi:hypothetical protein